MKKLFAAVAAIAALSGFQAGAADAAEKPLRVAVFVDVGACNIGAYRWLEIATTAATVVATPVDGASVRAGALDEADVIIMPGGGARREMESLGEEGREKVKAFIRGGGGYIGTCAGFYSVSQPTPGPRRNYLGLIPFVDTKDGENGQAELMFDFNENAERLAGIKKGRRRLSYSHGPVPVRTEEPVEGVKAEVVATFYCDYNPKRTPAPPKAGHPAVVAAECGKGRIFAFTCHPESDVDDHECIEGAFRYVTGREVRWAYPQRRRGQLAVGLMCDDSFGLETARLMQRLMREGEFDIVPMNKRKIQNGDLRHLDALLAPANLGKPDAKNGLYGDNLARTKSFIARGGLVLAWGNAAARVKANGLSGALCVANADAALAKLRDFAAEKAPQAAPLPAKVEKPVKIAVLAGEGCAMDPIAQILEFSPEYEVSMLDADKVASGAHGEYTALFVPGGYATVVWRELGESGRKAIEDFVRGGGLYYGVCSGAFLVSQTKMDPKKDWMAAGDAPFLGLVPFKEDLPHRYRGRALVNIRLTDEGKGMFTKTNDVHTVWYAGGPAFVDADPVDDSEFKVFARYDSCAISTDNPGPTPSMLGKAAIVGGRVGKGRVYAQCPHPESHEHTSDMARDALAWLTGVRPTGGPPARVRGARSVILKMGVGKGSSSAVRFALKTLLHDRRFDCSVMSRLDHNVLPHADAVVLCLFDGDSWTPALERFAANGGKVIVVADTEGKRALATKFAGATAVHSFDEVPAALR